MAADKLLVTVPPSQEDIEEDENHHYIMLFDDNLRGCADLASIDLKDEGGERRASLGRGRFRSRPSRTRLLTSGARRCCRFLG